MLLKITGTIMKFKLVVLLDVDSQFGERTP